MKKIIFIVFIILHFIPIRRMWLIGISTVIAVSTFNIEHCYSQWYQITLPVSGQVYKMQFINHNTGWASIYHGYDDFYLIKTTNSGSDWDIIFHDSAKVGTFQFINDTLGYAEGAGYLTHLISKTTNGGNNWTIMQSSSEYVFCGFYMVGADTGYVEVWYFNPPFSNEFIFRTINGFQTLDTVSIGIGGGTTSSMYFLKEKYNGEYCGFILGGDALLKTTNSGYNWQTINFPESGYAGSYSFINKDTGWVSYNPTIGNNSKILFTANAGQNWVTQYISSNQNDFGIIQAFNKNKIWCGKVYSNKIFVSTNGGLNWGYQLSQINSNWGIYIVDSLLGYSWSDYQVARTDNGGGIINQIINNKELITNDYALYQNYPNPFNSTTKIKYSIKNSEFRIRNSEIKIIVYNITGKEIETFVNKIQSPGEYSVKFNVSDFSSGIYFYSLIVDGIRVDTKKMVLVK